LIRWKAEADQVIKEPVDVVCLLCPFLARPDAVGFKAYHDYQGDLLCVTRFRPVDYGFVHGYSSTLR
jgi:hypothetical protein